MNLSMDAGWQAALAAEFKKPYYIQLIDFLNHESSKGIRVFPAQEDIFSAFRLTPFDSVKVVILGQDPYHGIHKAHGLAFSVERGIKTPPSLRNIYKELALEYPAFHVPNHGDLREWAKQGVLLLNTTLTVRESLPGSHQGRGWEQFTDRVIQKLSEDRNNLVFLLWGKHALKKSSLVDPMKHLILTAPHPSPFSAHTGFFGCKHFLQANVYLKTVNKTPIDWRISDVSAA